jgi:hypothetical protein
MFTLMSIVIILLYMFQPNWPSNKCTNLPLKATATGGGFF